MLPPPRQQLAAGWARELEAVAARIGAFVTHPQPRARVGRFLGSTLAGDGRRNSCTCSLARVRRLLRRLLP